MTVLVLEDVSLGFRGEITQWLLEVKAGVFIGNISAGVRERLWEKVKKNAVEGAALIIYSAQTEQGFAMEMYNMPDRRVVDFDGLYLIARNYGERITEDKTHDLW